MRARMTNMMNEATDLLITECKEREVSRAMRGLFGSLQERFRTLPFGISIIVMVLAIGLFAAMTGMLMPQQAVAASLTSCGDCHGYPPVDSSTRDASTGRFPGSHDMHTNTTTGYGFACSVCHVAPATTTSADYKHRTGNIQMAADIGGAGTGGTYGKGTSWAQTSSPTAFQGCSNTYCHSQGVSKTLQAGDTRTISSPVTTLTWSSTDACNSCHGTPPVYSNQTTSWGAAKANSHGSHTTDCSTCHYGTTHDNATIFDKTKHTNRYYDIVSKPGVTITSYTYNVTGGTCNNISCHLNNSAKWGVVGSVSCLTCHNGVVDGVRRNVIADFSAQSHHVQGTALATTDCYACHWEADSNGKTTSYHSGAPGGVVDLVINWTTTRPTVYSGNAVTYTANGSRSELAKLTTVCLSCHDDDSKTATPFGDGKNPSTYAWDGSSVSARYSSAVTAPWGKYSGQNVNPKNTVTKAYSAHGNAVANHGGWDINETWSDSRNGTENVQCIDCHNSHGSSVSGRTTAYTTWTGTWDGGILKDVISTLGGYTSTYKPTAGGSAATFNVYNPGAGLCFDCHNNASASSTLPWGYLSTYGATTNIMGYYDKPYWGNSMPTGPQFRFAYKNSKPLSGSHFVPSSSLINTPMGTINGLCTPCHDPHGVSPYNIGYCSNTAYVTQATCSTGGGSWTKTPAYGVPMLKGTWVTSPYREDAASFTTTALKGGGRCFTGFSNTGVPGYHIDQNTFTMQTTTVTSTQSVIGLYNLTSNMSFTPSRIQESAQQFAGLCLQCHPQSNLTAAGTFPWKDYRRIHKAVKGWATTTGLDQNNRVHAYTCSKCHTAHATCLPRLAVTNCTDRNHRGRVVSGGTIPPYNNTSTTSGGGRGRFPGGGGGYGRSASVRSWTKSVSSGGAHYFGTKETSRTPAQTLQTCHSAQTGTFTDNSWNSKTPW